MSEPASSALPRLPEGTIVREVSFAQLDGWAADDHAKAFSAFLATCPALLDGTASLRDAIAPPANLSSACQAARALGEGIDASAARTFFERWFSPLEIQPGSGQGFLTGYFEPEVEASLSRSAAFPVPVLGRPPDLETLKQGETRPGLDASLAAGRVTDKGLVPYFDRQAIWSGALDGQGLEIAWLADKAELFIIQVQGSARLRLPDGSRARLVYAGRNGLPYTSIGRILVETGQMPLADMTLARLMAWLRADPARGQALMEKNRSYVFFARQDAPPDQGPIGGAGVPLTTGRSLAVDRTIWAYGLPVFIETSPLTPAGPREKLNRLMIAQDTGSAIVGPARGDFFMGSGEEAGARAGLVRDAMRFVVFMPKASAP